MRTAKILVSKILFPHFFIFFKWAWALESGSVVNMDFPELWFPENEPHATTIPQNQKERENLGKIQNKGSLWFLMLCPLLTLGGGWLLAGKVNYYSSEVVGSGEESFSGLCFWSWDLWQLPITVG